MVVKYQNIQLTPLTPSDIIVGFLSDLVFKRGDFESRRIHIPNNWVDTSKQLPYPETFKTSPLYSELVKIGFLSEAMEITETFELCARKATNVSELIATFYRQLEQSSSTFLGILRDMLEEYLLIDDGFTLFQPADFQVRYDAVQNILELVPDESLSFIEDQELYKRWIDAAFQLHGTVVVHPHVGIAEMKFPQPIGAPLHVQVKVMNRTFKLE